MVFLNLSDYLEGKRSSKSENADEYKPFLPKTVIRYEIPETKPGYPWMELCCAMVAACTFFCCGVVASYTSGAIYSIQTDVKSNIHLTQSNISWIASAPPLAALFGTLLVGMMMEKLGRKKTITFLSIPFVVGWLIIGFAVNFTMILVGRLVTGLAFGMARACAPIYVSETARPQHRGKLGYLPPIMSAVGVLAGCMLGSSFNWKQLALLMAVFPAILLLASLYLPETPYWLISQNQEDQAFQALKQLRYRRGNVIKDDLCLYKEIQEIRETIEHASAITAPEYDHIHENESFRHLLSQPSVRRPAMLVFLLMVVQQFSGVSAAIYYMKMILTHGEVTVQAQAPTTSTEGPPHPTHMHNHDIRPTVFGIVHILAFFISLPLVDRLGRKILLMVSGVLMAFSHIILASYFFVYCSPVLNGSHLLASSAPSDMPLGVTVRRDMGQDPHHLTTSSEITQPMTDASSIHSWLPLVSLCAYIASFSLASPVPYILMSEMFSLNVRAYLSSAAVLICSVSSFIVVAIFPHLMYTISPVFTFCLFALFSLQTTVIGCIIPETKGKSLTEIENLFRGPRDFRGKVTATIEVPECAILNVATELIAETKRQASRRF